MTIIIQLSYNNTGLIQRIQLKLSIKGDSNSKTLDGLTDSGCSIKPASIKKM